MGARDPNSWNSSLRHFPIPRLQRHRGLCHARIPQHDSRIRFSKSKVFQWLTSYEKFFFVSGDKLTSQGKFWPRGFCFDFYSILCSPIFEAWPVCPVGRRSWPWSLCRRWRRRPRWRSHRRTGRGNWSCPRSCFLFKTTTKHCQLALARYLKQWSLPMINSLNM